MNRRERLMRTLRGETVERTPVCFYELNGLDEKPEDADPFNIYSHPSWRPLIDLTREKTDRIVMRGVSYKSIMPDPVSEFAKVDIKIKDGSRFVTQTVLAGGKMLTARTRRDRDVNTVWTEEHLLKDADDLKAFLTLPRPKTAQSVDTAGVLSAESALGDTGIVMIDSPDPLCLAASLFNMEEYTVIALTEKKLFRQLLEWFAESLLAKTSLVAEALPGRLWRIYGPEYAAEPYLPPALFREYVCTYVKPMIESIHRHGGFARIHCHGKLKNILDDIVGMGTDGLDPVEPPPQGDMELGYVREKCGKQLVLFGNLEISDIENLPTDKMAEKIKRAIDEGTAGSGRGFVLMPSACPYGRVLPAQTLRNYEEIVRIIGA